MSIKIKKFDPKKLEPQRRKRGPPTILIVGKRGSGKSMLTKDLLYYLRHIPTGVVLSGTEAGCKDFGKIIPSSFVYEKLNLDVVEQVIARQRKAMRHAPERKDRTRDLDTLMLFEDCMAEKRAFNKDQIRDIFMNGRHLGICFVMTMQYCMDITPSLRSQIDYVFAMREPFHNIKKKLYENFFGCIPSYKQFDRIFSRVTENYGALVFNSTVQAADLTDMIFHYKARDTPRIYRFGSKRLWIAHEEVKRKKKMQQEDARRGDLLFKEKKHNIL